MMDPIVYQILFWLIIYFIIKNGYNLQKFTRDCVAIFPLLRCLSSTRIINLKEVIKIGLSINVEKLHFMGKMELLWNLQPQGLED